MRILLNETQARMPLPATATWPADDALFVPANSAHRFVEFTHDLVTWAVFRGPKGGESQARSDALRVAV
jgi:hypothetical protein